jgi:K+-sensing histidine kinase KdpD
MMNEDRARLVEINKFLKKQNQAVMKMLEGYAALHFYYQQLFTKRTTEEVTSLMLEFIVSTFEKYDREIMCAIFFADEKTFDFGCRLVYPAEEDKKVFEAEFYEQTERGVFGWCINNQKISFFKSMANPRFPHGLLIPLYTPNKTLGMIFINVDCDPSFITHETLQILELSCTQTSLFLDNLKFV